MAFLFDVVVIWLGVLLMCRYRAYLIQAFLPRLPLLVRFVLLLIPLIMIEESINCIDYGDGLGCRTTPLINVILFMYVSLTALITHKTKRLAAVLLVATSIGVVWEVLAGGLSMLPFGPFYIFMVAHVAFSYLFILVLPLWLVFGTGLKNRSATRY